MQSKAGASVMTADVTLTEGRQDVSAVSSYRKQFCLYLKDAAYECEYVGPWTRVVIRHGMVC